TRAFAGRSRTYATLPWRGLSITFAFLLLVLAMRVYLGRFEELFDGHTIFTGVSYSDAHVMLPGLLVVCAALILGAMIAAANAARVHPPAGTAPEFSPLRRGIICLKLLPCTLVALIWNQTNLVRRNPYMANITELTRKPNVV